MFDWKRYWCPLGSQVHVDGAFLATPVQHQFVSINADLVETDDLPRHGVVILLGEAGLGKSSELQRLTKHESVRLVELVTLGPSDLRPVITEALSSLEPEGAVILDGLDELLIEIPRAGSILKGIIEQMEIKGGLLLSCRTGAWPETLSAELQESKGVTDVQVYELCMLSRLDVDLALQASDRSESFWNKVEAANVESLAAKPTTLNMLLGFGEADKLPSSRHELYDLGLLKLCQQPPGRSVTSYQGAPPLDAKQCLAVAERIAGRTLLSGYSDIVFSESVASTGAAINDASLVGGGSTAESVDAVPMTRATIRSVVAHTGLFSGRSAGVHGFAHRSYAEFLAAKYLKDYVGDAQRDSLLFVIADGNRRVAPQLNEVAAWMADLDEEFRNNLLEADPTVLLRSDLSSRTDPERLQIVQALFSAFESGAIYRIEDVLGPHSHSMGRFAVVRQMLRRLSSCGLSSELRPWLKGEHVSGTARQFAAELAAVAKCSDLVPELTVLALDKSEKMNLRKEASYAVLDFGDPAQQAALRPLLDEVDSDPDDELRGIALQALWDDHLSPMERLELLTEPKAPNFYGSYWRLMHQIEKTWKIDDADLPAALEWATNIHADVGRGTTGLGAIAGRIGYLAWQKMGVPGVLEKLVPFVNKQLGQHQPFMRVPEQEDAPLPGHVRDSAQRCIDEDVARRRKLLEACSSSLTDEKEMVRLIGFANDFSLAKPEDFSWAIQRSCELEAGPAEAMASLARMLGTYFPVGPYSSCEDLELWLRTRATSGVIRRVCDWPLSTELESDAAKRMKFQWQRNRRYECQRIARENRIKRQGTPVAWLTDAVDRALSDDIRFFHNIVDILFYGDKGSGPSHDDLTQCETWLSADKDLQNRVLECARRYLTEMRSGQAVPEGEGPVNEWDLKPWSTTYGYVLLLSVRPEIVHALPEARKRELVPILVHGASKSILDQDLVCGIVDSVCDEHQADLEDAVVEDIRRSRDKQHLPDVAVACSSRLGDGFGLRILNLYQNELKADPIGSELLKWLIRHEVSGAFEIACDALADLPDHPTDWGPCRQAISVLLAAPSDLAWDQLHVACERSPKWCQQVLELTAARSDSPTRQIRVHQQLRDDQLVQVVDLLFEHFPPNRDLPLGRTKGANQERLIPRWRASVLEELVQRGSCTTLNGLRGLRLRFEQYDWLRGYETRCVSQQAFDEWQPALPEALISMEEDTGRRLVRSGHDLLNVLIESLRAWEKHHHKHDTMALMWNEVSKHRWKPKDEETLSQALKSWFELDLQDRCILTGREVQLSRRTTKEGPAGTKVDIDVVATTDHPIPEPIRAVIEVKGSWNAGVKTAMQDQLVDRYFADNRYHHGLYVVGWYHLPGGSGTSGKRYDGGWKSADEATAELESQVDSLVLPSPGDSVRGIALDCSLSRLSY